MLLVIWYQEKILVFQNLRVEIFWQKKWPANQVGGGIMTGCFHRKSAIGDPARQTIALLQSTLMQSILSTRPGSVYGFILSGHTFRDIQLI